jgi:hypothetical protein
MLYVGEGDPIRPGWRSTLRKRTFGTAASASLPLRPDSYKRRTRSFVIREWRIMFDCNMHIEYEKPNMWLKLWSIHGIFNMHIAYGA